MENPYASGIVRALQTTALVAVVFGSFVFISWLNHKIQLGKLPVIDVHAGGDEWRKTYLQSARKLYRDGYQMFKDQAWVMPTSDDRKNVVVSARFLPELSKLPETVLSFPKAIKKVLEVKYTKTVPDDPLGPYCVRADLNPALSRLNPILNQEVSDSLKTHMPSCENWTPVFIHETLVKIIATVSGRIFVGPELCHNKDYLDTAVSYTAELMNAIQAVKSMNPIIRPFLAWKLPEVQKLNKREELAIKFFEPIVQARREAAKDPNYTKPDDMLQWLLNRSADSKDQSTRHIVKMQLLLIFAGIHSTTVTTTNVLQSLAISPEYLQPLREELRTVLANNSGALTSRALQQMEKLDSFMKETIRFYPPELTSFSRQTVKGITLSSGQYIPPGSFIETPSHAIYHDSANYPESSTFDGFRFYKMRQGGGAAEHARNQFVTSNAQNLVFGYGRHACPGRFLAAAEIKMILANILQGYDVKNADNEKERYRNHEIGRVVNTPQPKIRDIC
ncbi:hypothetical protein N7541_008540 [Penicillium brevicompactum]|uniref:Uncharacterized protein n=1 Tax=Penicillium brevicompactum TaxID=5074 RepID=A0A9W9UMR0_PENBR|nr:hypothetical protein N7541_008540 [Penicillium brevicompactum]